MSQNLIGDQKIVSVVFVSSLNLPELFKLFIKFIWSYTRELTKVYFLPGEKNKDFGLKKTKVGRPGDALQNLSANIFRELPSFFL